MERKDGYKKTEIGWIPEDWEISQISDISEINKSSLPNNTAPSYQFDYIDIASIIRPNFISSVSTFSYASAPVRARRLVQYGDIIVSTVRPYLKAFAIIPWRRDNIVCSTGFAVIRVKNRISNTFLFQYILSDLFLKQVNLLLVGSNYPAINSSDLKKLEVPLPPLPEQQKIAEVLTTVDDKISSIEDQIQQTEQLKKGLMEKLLTEGIGHTEFKDTEIGRIPTKWDLRLIGDFVETIKGGASLKPSDFTSNGFKVLPKKGVVAGGILKIDEKEQAFCSIEYAESNISNVIDQEYLITTLRDLVPTGPSIGYIVKFNSSEKYILAQGVYGFKIAGYLDRDFLIQFSNTKKYRKVMQTIMVGSTQVHIRNKDFLNVKIPYPPLPEQKQIASILTAVDDKIETLNSKKTEYQTLKKGLMAELLTGKRRVKV